VKALLHLLNAILRLRVGQLCCQIILVIFSVSSGPLPSLLATLLPTWGRTPFPLVLEARAFALGWLLLGCLEVLEGHVHRIDLEPPRLFQLVVLFAHPLVALLGLEIPVNANMEQHFGLVLGGISWLHVRLAKVVKALLHLLNAILRLRVGQLCCQIILVIFSVSSGPLPSLLATLLPTWGRTPFPLVLEARAFALGWLLLGCLEVLEGHVHGINLEPPRLFQLVVLFTHPLVVLLGLENPVNANMEQHFGLVLGGISWVSLRITKSPIITAVRHLDEVDQTLVPPTENRPTVEVRVRVDLWMYNMSGSIHILRKLPAPLFYQVPHPFLVRVLQIRFNIDYWRRVQFILLQLLLDLFAHQ